jgi:outer membrane protein assembly factor BamB
MKRAVLAFFLFVFSGCTDNPKVVWKYQTGGGITKTPAISGNSLFVPSHDHNLYSLDLKTGKVLWKTDLGDRLLMTPVAEGNNVYVGNAAGYFFQVDATTGVPKWKFQTMDILEFDPCVDADGIYFGSYDGKFYKIKRNGELLWSFKTGFYLSSTCAFYDDLVITTSWDMNVYAIRRDTGEEVWRVKTPEYAYGNGTVSDDSVYYGTHHLLYRIDAKTGKVIYKKEAGYNTHVLVYQGSVYTQENGLTIRKPDGTVVKSIPIKVFSEFTPVVVNRTILQSDLRRYLIGFSPDLEELWKFRAKDHFWSPGIYHDGIYYIGNRDSTVYALRLPS